MDEDSSDGKVPWRTIVLWVVASAVGGLASWLYSHSSNLTMIREQQVVNTNVINNHSERLNSVDRRLEIIETTKTDKRFRSDDWEAQRKILDAEFRSVWKAIEDCKKPTR